MKFEDFQDIYHVVKKILSSHTEIEIHEESPINELGISSLDFVITIIEIEDVFKINFDDYALMFNYFETIKDIANYILMKITE